MAFCLPKEIADKFLQALKNGVIVPEKLFDMSSLERRTFFENIVGKENAQEVNAQLESKILLQDQKRGMVSWAKNIAGITEPVRRDLISKIERMNKILTPENEQAFLKDLASKKLGADVSLEEAQKITDLSQKVKIAEQDLKTTPSDKIKQIAYGRKIIDLTEYVNSLKPRGSLFTFANIVNLPKSALTSVFHFSASFVQNWGMISTVRFWEAFGQQFRYFFSPEAYKDLNASIISHPDYTLAKNGKLGLTALGDKLSLREEAIQSSLLEHIPVLKHLVLASSRAFTGVLNYTRFHRFADLLSAARLAGEDIRLGSRAVRDIAKTVNDFTGRGAMGKGDIYGNVTPTLNSIFFSPRKISATIEMFNPARYLDPRVSKTARLGALRQLMGSVIATGAVVELAHLAGAKVDLNPISSNFMKVKIGKVTFDMTGGNAIYIRLLTRLITNQAISAKGKKLITGKFGSETRADLAINYIRGKLSPTASAIADWLYGKDEIGQPFNATDELKQRLTPIVIQQFVELAESNPKDAMVWVPAVSAIFGVEMRAEVPRRKK